MSDGNKEENLIAIFERSLRETRNAQNRLLGRLKVVESEAEQFRQEIRALENSAKKTEEVIMGLIDFRRSGVSVPDLVKNLRIEDDYEIPSEVRNGSAPDKELQEYLRSDMGRGRNYSRNEGNSRRSSVAYMNEKGRGMRGNNPAESRSDRFSDRTITQACTLILGESNEALHVNELYNLLVAGGFQFTGNNPTISIAVSLNRNRRFQKVAPGTFDLVMRDASKAAS